jgi:hypothetical protein
MKTHIIQLERDDNVISIIDKIAWGKAKRVLLVFPAQGGLIIHRMDLQRILRAAQKMSFSLGLVSRKREVGSIAKELGIPIFGSIREAQGKSWHIHSKPRMSSELKSIRGLRSEDLKVNIVESSWRSKIAIRLGSFGMGVLAVFAIIFIFLPSARIQIDPIEENQVIYMDFSAMESLKEINLSGVVPSRLISVEAEGNSLVNVSSEKKIPEKFATGLARFTNQTNTSMVIPAGTIVTMMNYSGIRYETTEKGELPPRIGGTINLPIIALASGEGGNLAANRLDSVVGDLGINLSVSNPEAILGGMDRYTIMPDQKDQNELFSTLESELRVQAFNNAQSSLAQGDIIFPDTIRIKEIIIEEYIPAIGQPGNQLSLHLVVSYSMNYAKYIDLVNVANPILQANLPSGFQALEGSILIETTSEPETNLSGITQLNLKLGQRILKEIDPFMLASLVQGLPPEDARKLIIARIGMDAKPLIEINPSWWKRLPIIALRIAIDKEIQ